MKQPRRPPVPEPESLGSARAGHVRRDLDASRATGYARPVPPAPTVHFTYPVTTLMGSVPNLVTVTFTLQDGNFARRAPDRIIARCLPPVRGQTSRNLPVTSACRQPAPEMPGFSHAATGGRPTSVVTTTKCKTEPFDARNVRILWSQGTASRRLRIHGGQPRAAAEWTKSRAEAREWPSRRHPRPHRAGHSRRSPRQQPPLTARQPARWRPRGNVCSRSGPRSLTSRSSPV
jgi:hypothetical protein